MPASRFKTSEYVAIVITGALVLFAVSTCVDVKMCAGLLKPEVFRQFQASKHPAPRLFDVSADQDTCVAVPFYFANSPKVPDTLLERCTWSWALSSSQKHDRDTAHPDAKTAFYLHNILVLGISALLSCGIAAIIWDQ